MCKYIYLYTKTQYPHGDNPEEPIKVPQSKLACVSLPLRLQNRSRRWEQPGRTTHRHRGMVIVVSLSRDTHKRTKKWGEEGKRESSGKETWKQNKGQEEVIVLREDRSTLEIKSATETRRWCHCCSLTNRTSGGKTKGGTKRKIKLQLMEVSHRAERKSRTAAVDHCLKQTRS